MLSNYMFASPLVYLLGLHTYCTSCLSVMRKENHLVCPLCHIETVDTPVEDLLCNFAILQASSAVKERLVDEVVCDCEDALALNR